MYVCMYMYIYSCVFVCACVHIYMYINTQICITYYSSPTPPLPLQVFELKEHPYYIGCQFHPEFKSLKHKPYIYIHI